MTPGEHYRIAEMMLNKLDLLADKAEHIHHVEPSHSADYLAAQDSMIERIHAHSRLALYRGEDYR